MYAIERVMGKASETLSAIDDGNDDKGCKVCSQYWIHYYSNNSANSILLLNSNNINVQGRQRQQ